MVSPGRNTGCERWKHQSTKDKQVREIKVKTQETNKDSVTMNVVEEDPVT